MTRIPAPPLMLWGAGQELGRLCLSALCSLSVGKLPHNLIMNANKRRRTSDSSSGLVRTVTLPRGGRRVAKPRLYKTLKYNGEVAFTRTASATINIISTSGFNIGGAGFPAISFAYDPTGVTIFGSSTSFLLAPLINSAEIAALWDRVMIDKVELTMDFIAAKAATGGLTPCPKMFICNDPNNAGTGSTLDFVKQHTTCRALYGERPHKHTVYPKHQRLVYYTALSSSFEPARGFVNSDTAIPHYSTHLALESTGLADATYLSIAFKFFLRAKDVK